MVGTPAASVSQEPDPVNVAVYIIRPFVFSDRVAALSENLSLDEREKAGRFVHAADRRRYVISHALLRRALGRECGMEPGELRFGREPQGKPFLERADRDLTFSLSHSGDLIAIAIARGRAVGIDVEQVRADMRLFEDVTGQLAPQEQADLRAISGEAARFEAFFRTWTRKEAYLKARGAGLHYPLDHFAVTVRPAEKPAVAWIHDDPAPARWLVRDLAVPPGYAGAVVAEGPGGEIVFPDPAVLAE